MITKSLLVTCCGILNMTGFCSLTKFWKVCLFWRTICFVTNYRKLDPHWTLLTTWDFANEGGSKTHCFDFIWHLAICQDNTIPFFCWWYWPTLDGVASMDGEYNKSWASSICRSIKSCSHWNFSVLPTFIKEFSNVLFCKVRNWWQSLMAKTAQNVKHVKKKLNRFCKKKGKVIDVVVRI